MLKDILEQYERGPVVDQCVEVLNAEVASKKGLSGLAVKGGFKVIAAVKPGFIRAVIDGLLDEFVEELLSKLLYYVSFWYVGKVNTEEEFKKLLNETERAENLGEESSQQEGVDKKESSNEKTPAPPKKNEKPEAKAKAK